MHLCNQIHLNLIFRFPNRSNVADDALELSLFLIELPIFNKLELTAVSEASHIVYIFIKQVFNRDDFLFTFHIIILYC